LNDGVRADLGVNSRDAHDRGARPRRDSTRPRRDSNCCSDDGRLEVLWQFQVHLARCGNFVPSLTCGSTRERDATRGTTGVGTFVVANSESGEDEVRSYRITLRDRETETVVGYYDGSWTTDRRRALVHRRREVAEAHAACMRERCPRNADLIKVEELDAAD
jgi:hypothetical protein